MVWLSDESGACTFLSRCWSELTGQEVDAGLGGGWLTVLHPDDRDHALAVFRAAHEERQPYAADYRLRSADGSYRWAFGTGRPDYGPDGEFRGFVGVLVDIHERKRAEITLRRLEQKARFLANASVALSDISEPRAVLRKVASLAVPFFADWCTVDVRRGDGVAERLTVVHSDPGKTSQVRAMAGALPDAADVQAVMRVAGGQAELVARVPPLEEWVHDEERRELLRELGIASYVCVPVLQRGRTLAVLLLVTGDPEREYGPDDLRTAEDLAYRTSLAIENAELYHAALEADRRKDHFLATLSHELRTPLNAIVGWTHILKDSAADAATVRKAADTIYRNAQVQTQLISDILDVSRIIQGQLRLDVRPVDLAVIVLAALDTVRPAAQARAVRLETILDPRAGLVSGDAERLQQVVWNLVSNAIKFVPEKTGHALVRLEAVNSHVRIVVEDNGPGIDPEFLPHVFERFRQADSTSSRRHQGLGLGLAIVKHLVELHGGTVRAENRAERPGALFTIELPRRSVAVAIPDTAASERHPAVEEPVWLASAPSLAGLSVLVVDDHADARELVKAVLERCGAKVEAMASARAALAAVRAARPDVLVVDIEMPDESGYDFIRQLRALPPDQGGLVPAAALTAYATAQDRVNALRAGFQMHVPKPVMPAELAAIVASLVRKTGF